MASKRYLGRRGLKVAPLIAVLAASVVGAEVAAAAKGELSYLKRTPDFALAGATDLAVSPDNEFIYAGDGAASGANIVVLQRDETTGDLSLVETESGDINDGSDVGGTPEMDSIESLAVSPDGTHLYATETFGSGGIVIFDRDATSGKLSYDSEVIGGHASNVERLDISGDGETVYASSGDSLVAYDRDTTTGALTEIDYESDGINDPGDAGPTVNGLNGATEVAVAPDGEAVYVAGEDDDAIAVFVRNPPDGELSFVEAQVETTTVGSGGPVSGLSGITSLVVSRDDENVYAIGDAFSESLVTFDRDDSDETLDYIETLEDGSGGVDGLDSPTDIATSGGAVGRSIYVSDGSENSIALFDRNASTGELTFTEIETNGTDDVGDVGPTVEGVGYPSAILAPGVNSVYAGMINNPGVAHFSRNPTDNGKLSFRETVPETDVGYTRAAAVTPDGGWIFSVDDIGDEETLRAFERDPITGDLTPGDIEIDGVDDPSDPGAAAQGLYSATNVAVAPGGDFVYVTADDLYSIATFSFNDATGELSFVEIESDGVNDPGDSGPTVDGLYEPYDLAIAPDGSSVYVTGSTEDAVAAFDRDPGTGELNFVEAEKDGVGGADGLEGARPVAVAPDGQTVYVGGVNEDALAAFERNTDTGALTPLEVERDGVNDPDDPGGAVTGMGGMRDLIASGDGDDVYAVSNGIVAFSRDGAGKLSFAESEIEGVDDPNDSSGPAQGLDIPRAIVESPDGEELYVVADDFAAKKTIATFARSPLTGAIGFLEVETQGQNDPGDPGGQVEGLRDASSIFATSDQRHVYVAARDDQSITSFAREDDFVAPDTTITGGPADGSKTNDPTPSFTYTSNESAVSFQCSVDGGAFGACADPLPTLGDGSHTFAVRAQDDQGNLDATPDQRSLTVDTALDGPKIKAAKKQKMKGSKIEIEIELKVAEDATGTGKGKVEVGKKSYKLAKVEKPLEAGSNRVLKLKPANKKDAKKIAKALKKGKKAKAKLTGKITDEAGNSVSGKPTVKLKPKR